MLCPTPPLSATRCRQILLLCGLALSAPALDALAADTCLEQVEILAGRYDLEINPTDMAAETLPDSDATKPLVVAPNVVQPPENASGKLVPTAPLGGAEPNDLTDADRAELTPILIDARRASQGGDTAGCLRHLKQAKELLGRIGN